MPGKAAKVTLTERQCEVLLAIRDAASGSHHLRQRATIILLAFDGWRNAEIAVKVGLGQRFVGAMVPPLGQGVGPPRWHRVQRGEGQSEAEYRADPD